MLKKNKSNIFFDFYGKKSDRKVVIKIINALSLISKTSKRKKFSLAIVSSSEIKKWNFIYRGKNKKTDVLSFSELELAEIIPKISNEKIQELGEIIICDSIMSKQAKFYGWSREEELARLLVHGLAHLYGYDHENVNEEERLRMEKFEKKILKQAGFNF